MEKSDYFIDFLAFETDELLIRFGNALNKSEETVVLREFFQQFSYDKKSLICNFEKDLDWFNVTEPIGMDGLKGKLVILDFFTYCCINCMHVLPDLKKIEERFTVEDGLVIIGIHSPKFENEKDSANILSAIQRYNITHPIVNDMSSCLWNNLKIKCWPTLVVISPIGIPLIVLMGEGHGRFLKKFIKTALLYYKQQNLLNNFQLPLSPSTNLMPASNLKFPAKIASSQTSDSNFEMFAISDSGNHRILVINSEGKVLYKIGGPEPQFTDGNFETARFNSPQGLTFMNDDMIIVADTNNHAIRKIILSVQKVVTLVGTGRQGVDKVGGNIGLYQDISSPWDVAVFKTRDMDMSFHMDEKNVTEKHIILIAMAGTHQIWGYFVEGIIWWKFKKFEPEMCVSLIGNGVEENRNNSYPQNAAFAQPSGLAMANDFLFIADSESSSVRKASMLDGKVMAVVGGDRNPLNLFAYGDIDGNQFSAKLQHPLGLAYNNVTNEIFVSDTYNHKIKRIDINANNIYTCLIKDEKQCRFQFNEPGGLCFDTSGKNLYVADTNNHNIHVVSIDNMTTKRLNLNFSKYFVNNSPASSVQLKKAIPLNTSKKIILNFVISLENELKFTENAPQTWNVILSSTNYTSDKLSGEISNGKWCVEVLCNSLKDDSCKEEIIIDCSLNLCNESLCIKRTCTITFISNASKKFIDSHFENVCLIVSESYIYFR